MPAMVEQGGNQNETHNTQLRRPAIEIVRCMSAVYGESENAPTIKFSQRDAAGCTTGGNLSDCLQSCTWETIEGANKMRSSSAIHTGWGSQT